MAAPSDSPTPSPEMTRSSPPMILLQSPRKWRSQHLEAANLKQTLEVPALELLGDTYVPEDGDEDFEALAKFITRPSRDELGGEARYNYREKGFINLFSNAFADITRIAGIEAPGFTFFHKRILDDMFGVVGRGIGVGDMLMSIIDPMITFEIPALHVYCEYRCDGAIVRSDGAEDENLGVPLAITSIVSSSYRPEFARSEVPQLLIQAVFAYLQNPGLEKYTGFVVSLDRTVVHVAKGVMTEKYLKSLCSGQALNGDLEFYRSEAFDLLERDGRREFLRVLVGMLKYLAEEND